MPRFAVRSLAFATLAALAVAGCHEQEPMSPTAGLTEPVDPPKSPDLGRGATRYDVETLYSMYVDDSVRGPCSGPDPFFRFDSAKANGKDEATMQTLVHCMQDGPLRGKTIMLVGRTDPRGSDAYNDKLGLERAERVKRYLVANGIAGERIQTATAGKDDARPMPAEWAGDRRVEVRLAQ